MKKTETYGMNIIEGTDRIDYAVINENTEFTEVLIKENADSIEALSDDIEAIEEAMADDVAEINKRLKKVEIKATEITSTFTGDITGDNFTIKNPNSETVTVEYNGLSEDIPSGETIEVRIFTDENDYHLELTASADIELTYCMRNQKYIQKIASEGITVDEELSATSTNPAQNRAISAEFTKFDEKKVDKVEGKSLSTNDYTDEEKEKLADLENYDDAEIKSEIEGCVKAPQTAEVGQVLVVKVVDESGKPVEWECVEKGGGVDETLVAMVLNTPEAKGIDMGDTKILYGSIINTGIPIDAINPFAEIAVGKCEIYNRYNKIRARAFKNCTNLTSIIIPEGVTSIGTSVFENCTNLTSITIPESVTSIGGYTFENCVSLTSITIPESVTSINIGTFKDCTNLTSITIPESVTSINTSAFYGCTGLTSITIPESVTSIGNITFKNCTNLTSIIINKPKNSISGSPWGATNATVIWNG